MEDKWFIFMEDDCLHFHRSWTGGGIYKVFLLKNGETYKVNKAVVNSGLSSLESDGIEYQADLLNFLINNLLLGKNEPLPMPPVLPKEKIKGVYQHHVSGTGYPELKPKKPWWKFW